MYRFQSNYAGNGNGFEIVYNAFNFTCNGHYYNQSGILTSPLYPNAYPTADCVYLISQPDGKFVNISILNFDIDCQGVNSASDFLEMRDGDSEDSPLMGRFCGEKVEAPACIQTTQNHLRIRRVLRHHGLHSHLF